MQICISFPPPSYKDLADQFTGYRLDLNLIDTLAGLIGLPVPIYLTYKQYMNEVSQIIQYWQTKCTTETLLTIAKSLIAVVGGALRDLLPQVPYLNISVLDLISMSGSELRKIITDAYKKEKDALLSALKSLIPNPLFPTLEFPHFSVNAIIKALQNYCITALIEVVQSLIEPVLKILELAGSLTLPKIPTLQEIGDMLVQIAKEEIKAIVGEIEGEIEQIKDDFTAIKTAVKNYGLEAKAIFDKLSFSGLPKISLPSPLLPDFKSLGYEIREYAVIYFSGLLSAITQKIVDFVKTVLSVLNIQFPSICINLPLINADTLATGKS